MQMYDPKINNKTAHCTSHPVSRIITSSLAKSSCLIWVATRKDEKQKLTKYPEPQLYVWSIITRYA